MGDEVRGREDRAERALEDVARNSRHVAEQLADLLEIVRLVRRDHHHRQAARLETTRPFAR
jgi:hypothetical protein